MRTRLTSDALLLGGVLLLTLGIAVFAVYSGHGRDQEEELTLRRTTYSTAPGGYQALFVAMESLDYPVRRWRVSLDHLAGPGTVVVASPETPITDPEWRGLAAWVRQGNLLIYLADRRDALEPIADRADLRQTPARISQPVQPVALAATAPNFRTRSMFHLDEWAPSPLIPDVSPMTPLYQDDRGATVGYLRWGRGAVILCSSPWSLSTAGVGTGDNFAWLLATVAAYGPRVEAKARGRGGEGGTGRGVGARARVGAGAGVGVGGVAVSSPRALAPIFFDEYHHGYAEARGVLSLLAPIARLGLAQVGVAWLLLTYAVSRRFGGRVPDEGRVRRSRSEYLGSMASLLQRARAVDLAVAQVRRQFLHDATRALGLPRDAAESALLAAAATRGLDPEHLRSLLERAERLTGERDRTQQEEALTIARDLVRLRRQLSGAASPAPATQYSYD